RGLMTSFGCRRLTNSGGALSQRIHRLRCTVSRTLHDFTRLGEGLRACGMSICGPCRPWHWRSGVPERMLVQTPSLNPSLSVYMQPRIPLIISALLLGMSRCGTPYDPPVLGDHTSEQYKADLEKCRTTSSESVRLKNAATPQSWIISPFT